MEQQLAEFRKQINVLDEELLTLLAKRMEVVRKIGALKKENNIPVLDENRWQEVLKTKKLLGKTLNLPANLIEIIYTTIHEFSLKEESKTE